MKKRFLFVAFVILICMSISVLGHSGRTDSRGGHKDNISGGYHYHHGYSAHQHPNGVCPYRSSSSSGAQTQKSQQAKKQKESWLKPKLEVLGKKLSEVSLAIEQEYQTILARLNESTAGKSLTLMAPVAMVFSSMIFVCVLIANIINRPKDPYAPVFERIGIFLGATIRGLWNAFYWSCIWGWGIFICLFLTVLPSC